MADLSRFCEYMGLKELVTIPRLYIRNSAGIFASILFYNPMKALIATTVSI